jgi:hypothetical protein
VVGHHLGQEALAFADALDLDRDRVDRLIESRQTLGEHLRQLGDRNGSAAPEPASVRDGEREQHEEGEDTGHDRDLLGHRVRVRWRRRLGHLGCSARDRCRLGDGVIGSLNLLLQLDDALVHRRDSALDAVAIDPLIAAPKLLG